MGRVADTTKNAPRKAAARRVPVSAPMPPEPVVEVAATAEPEVVRQPIGRERVPMGAQRQKLATEQRDGFVRRWFNDEPGRIAQALGAGYTYVDDSRGHMTFVVGKASAGGGLAAYLMEIPEEFYREDQEAKDAQARQFDEDVRRGAGAGRAPGVDGRYVPMKGDGTPRIAIKDAIRRG